MTDRKTYTLLLLFVLLLTGLYSNHFDNSFQFDDGHSIVENPAIRTLEGWTEFFTTSTKFSNLPDQRTYRPLLSLTLAIDYFLADGYSPTIYHVQSFFWFILTIVFTFLLQREVLSRVGYTRNDSNSISLFASAWFAVHPVIAETVNYIIQRGDILSTLGVVAGVYASLRGRFILGLLLGALGCLSKQSALVFGGLLFISLLVENPTSLRHALRSALKASPAVAMTVAYYFFQGFMASSTFVTGGKSALLYLLTQPSVIGHYVLSFFAPLWLTADSDWSLVDGFGDPRTWFGIGVLLSILAIGLMTLKERKLYPISFGIFWMLISLVPTSSIIPWAEVMNDHRMFFPFVGLSLAICSAIFLVFSSLQIKLPGMYLAALLLLPYAYGTYLRNEIWDNEISLWADASEKSPGNGRALMNFGCALMRQGALPEALALFEGAKLLAPNYHLVETNLGIVKAALGDWGSAKVHFDQSITLKPQAARTYFFFASWLSKNGEFEEADKQLELSLKNNPTDQEVASFRKQNLIQLSLTQYNRQDFEGSLYSAKKAVALDPNSAEGWNNIGAAYLALGRGREAIAPLSRALELNPGLEIAKNNLATVIDLQSSADSKQH